MVITKRYINERVLVILYILVIIKMEQITFKLTDENKEKIRNQAEKIGLGMAPYVRHIVLRELSKEGSE